MRVTEIYNLDIYGDNGQYLGEVRDAIIDLERGEVSRLLMEEWRNSDRVEAKRLLSNRSILFKNIRNIGDVVLVASSGQSQTGQQDTGSSPELSDLASRR
ncbi:MAG: PRC-barrel domain-containing protein [Candidatus Micrarchaeota archaeon]|nr:PRC-barrel domain-containing protein [Candidatus Micrarchaeota archaeon]